MFQFHASKQLGREQSKVHILFLGFMTPIDDIMRERLDFSNWSIFFKPEFLTIEYLYSRYAILVLEINHFREMC